MTENSVCEKIHEVIDAYAINGTLTHKEPYGNGHINDTFLLTYDTPGGVQKYILQRMNHSVFKNPQALMENISRVTSYLRQIIIRRGGNPDRETLNVIRTADDSLCYKDSACNYWRMFLFIDDTICLEQVEDPREFYDSAVALGTFQQMLADYPAHTLHETIPNFHNTPSRFEDFRKAVERDALGRAHLVREEIDFALSKESDTRVLTDLAARGELPLRVTHNDTKINNILFDRTTKKPLCIIDLDTVMPGLSHYDFGDSIRTGASTGAEDEQDLSKIELNLALYETFTKGFLEGCQGSLTKREIEFLPMGAKLMTYECGIRFLADYLDGDVYFKIHRDGQNLERARTQFKLVADMEQKWEAMCAAAKH